MKETVCVLLLVVVAVNAHSWIGCTDYRGDVSYYDDSKCYAYPRSWGNARGSAVGTGYNLGIDTGFNFQGKSCNLPITNPISNAYTSKFPMAIYEQGKTYCLAWPTKNHVAATCTNQWIPDTQLSMFMGTAVTNPSKPQDPAWHPEQSGQWTKLTDYFGKHINSQIDCLGFQRSPAFCTNMDKALATGCFTVPSNAAIGIHTFMWYWIFNQGTEPYVTCWDAQVVAPGSGRGAGKLVVNLNYLKDTLGSGGSTCSQKWASVSGSGPTFSSIVEPVDSTGDNNNGNFTGTVTTPLSGDSVIVVKYPPQLPLTGTFSLDVQYVTQGLRALTVDILDRRDDGNWYGKGVIIINRNVTNAETVTVTVQIHPDRPLSNGQNYFLRAWLVDLNLYSLWQNELTKPVDQQNSLYMQPWTQELSRYDVQSPAYTSTTTPPQPSSADAFVRINVFVTLSLVLALFAVF